ncbi:hypothetical protein EMCRGX_G005215 [Ephydatia muelleri]
MGQAATQPIPAARDGDIANVEEFVLPHLTTDQNNTTPLYVASEKGDHDGVQRLLGACADVNVARSDDGCSPLYIAGCNGYLDVVKTLLEAGANINQANNDGWSPLYTAGRNGHYDVVKALMEAGANINQATKGGWSPLYTASFSGHLDVVETLMEAGANINQATKYNATPLYAASEEGHDHVVQTLLRAGADVNIVTSDDGWSPLITASFYGHTAIVKTLIKAGVNVNHANKDGETALDLAVEKGHKEIIEVLKTYQSKVIPPTILVQRAEKRAARDEQEPSNTKQKNKALVIPQYSWRVERDEIEVTSEEPLGVGAWGEVRVAMFRGARVAAKFIHKAIISPHNINLFLREMHMAASVRHPNLLLFIGASLDDSKPVILTELMPKNLRCIIVALPRHHVITIGTDVARGLNYLHLMRPDPIIHRDVSSANVLLEPIGSGNWKAKVSDYGSANFLSKAMTMGPGNASYAAPESFNPKLQSPKMDVYSYGILLLEMATGQFPDHMLQTMQLDALHWQEMAMMIRRCICEDPASRPAVKDLLPDLTDLDK